MLLATAAWVHHAPRRSSASPTAPLGPFSRAHRGRAKVHLGGPSPRRGRLRRNPGRAPGKGRRSGRSRPASGPASPPGSRCPGGGSVPGEAGPRTAPATRPRGLQSLWPPHCPCLSPSARGAQPARMRAVADSPVPRAHAPSPRPGARRPRTRARSPSLARSLARTRGSCAPTSAASRSRRPAALHTPRGALSRPSRSPSSTSTVVLGMRLTLEGQRLGGLVETSRRFLFKIHPLCLLPLFPS